MTDEPDERLEAIAQALAANSLISEELGRARIIAVPADDQAAVDVTEAVVHVMDKLTETLDWGSGFFNDDELASFYRLAELLKIEARPPNSTRPASPWLGLDGQLALRRLADPYAPPPPQLPLNATHEQRIAYAQALNKWLSDTSPREA